RDVDIFGVAAVTLVAEDLVARALIVLAFQAPVAVSATDTWRHNHALARVFPLAGDVGAENMRHGDLHPRHALADEQVEMVEGTCPHPHPHLAGSGHRRGYIFQFQHFGAAVLVESHGLHAVKGSSKANRPRLI